MHLNSFYVMGLDCERAEWIAIRGRHARCGKTILASDWGGCSISSVTRGILRARIGLLPQVIKLCLLLIAERRVEGGQSRTHSLSRTAAARSVDQLPRCVNRTQFLPSRWRSRQ
jgi:hypothetical protein